MKTFTFLIIITLLCACVLGDISLSEVEGGYKIGQRINLSATLDYTTEIYGFFALTLVCDNSETEYFKVPLLLEESKDIEVIAAPLRLSNAMADSEDECYILARFLTQDNTEKMSEKSKRFDVVSGFNVTVELDKDTYSPGETLNANINIDFDDTSEIRVDMFIDKKMSSYDFTENEFTISYVLPSSVSSGEQEILFQIEDSFGNSDEIEKEITILSLPNRIVNMFSRKTYYANQEGEEFSFKPVLYDQGTEVFDDKSIQIRILNSDGKEIASDSVISTVRFITPITVNMKPGTYKVISVFQDIEQESSFTVLNGDYIKSEGAEEEEETDESAEDDAVFDLDNEKEDSAENKDDEKSNVNIWKLAFVILVLVILFYIAYSFGKGSKKRHEKSLKSDKFYNLHKKEEKKPKTTHPRVIKANPEDHEEDEEF